MSQPNINTPNSDLVSSLSQSQSYFSSNFLVILPESWPDLQCAIMRR